MRIVFVAWRDLANPLAGGSEILVDRLAGGLTDRGHQVDLLCGGPADHRRYPVTITGGTYTQFVGAPLRYLRSHQRSDLVVEVANGMPFFSPLWRRGPTLCLVNHVHLDMWKMWFPPVLAAVGRVVEGWALPAVHRHRRFVAVSASTVDGLVGLGVGKDRIRVVHNGVDLPPQPAAKSPEPLFLAMGRLVPHKRFDLLLRLWEVVRPITGGRLVVAGEGPDHERLQAMAGTDAYLPGRVSEEAKDELLGSAWLLLHPAQFEGWGLVVMEAAAHRTPTVGFDVAGVRDSVVDGHSGALAATEEEFVRAWVELAGDQVARQLLGDQARDRAARFSWSATVERFAEVMEEVVATSVRTRETGPTTARRSRTRADTA